MVAEHQIVKEGDVVTLKSGGPEMTVQKSGYFRGELKCACVWFEGNKEMHGLFEPFVLAIADRDGARH